MERWVITLSGVCHGGLDCCAKKAHHPLWTVLVDSSAPEKHIQTSAVQASDPTRTLVPHSIIFHPFHLNCAGHPSGTRTLAGLWPR